MVSLCQAAATLFLACALPILCTAQMATTLNGTVEDQSAAVIPSAKATLLNKNSGESRRATTDEEGHFLFKNVASGEYLLTVESAGFQNYGTTVAVTGPALNLKIRMKIAAGDQIIVSSTPADRISPESNADALKINDNFLRALPAESQNLSPLLTRFLSPAASATAGPSIVVDGIETDQLDDLPVSAIKRIAIDRNPYSAEYRRPGKARVEVTTKTGSTSLFHGGVALYWRNSVFDARNPLAQTKPNLNRSIWDATFSGPFRWKKSSFFLAAQQLTSDESVVVKALTPTGPLLANVPTSLRSSDLLGRIDLRRSSHTLSFLYGFTGKKDNNRTVGGLSLLETGSGETNRADRIQFTDKATLSPTLLNTLRIFARKRTTRVGALPLGPAVVVNGAFVGGVPQASKLEHQGFVEVDNTTIHTRGDHLFRFGGTARTWTVHGTDQSNFGGTFEFGDLHHFALQRPYVFRINQGPSGVSFSVGEISGFLQSDLKLHSNLNLSAGLRYDWQSVLGRRHSLAPRFAVAYAPGDQKTVLRAGAGIFYENLPEAAIWRASILNGIQQTQWVRSNPAYPNAGSPGSWNVPPSTFHLAKDLEVPYLLHASVSVERQLSTGTQLTLETHTLRGLHLFRTRDTNAPLPQTGVRPLSGFLNLDQLESTAAMRSTGFSVNFRGHLGKRTYIVAQYTLSNTIDDAAGLFTLPANNYDLRAERGRAGFDRLHQLTLTGMVDLPASIRIGAVLALSSAPPFDITTGFDNNHDTVATDRPPGITRNAGQAAGLAQLDLRCTKRFRFPRFFNREGAAKNVDLSIDAFNVLNHTNYSTYVGVTSSALFGRPVTALPARTVQLSIRYRF
jgi:Carboxypeptidase regulatory-like domain/TonB dependent receptor